MIRFTLLGGRHDRHDFLPHSVHDRRVQKYFQKSVFFTGFLQLYYILSIPQLEERSCRICRKGIKDSLGCIEGGRHDRQMGESEKRGSWKKKFGNLVKNTTLENIFL